MRSSHPEARARTLIDRWGTPPLTAPAWTRRPLLRTALATLGVAALLVLLTWTMLTHASRLVTDFPTDTWLIEHQADSLRHGYLPSLFTHSDVASFYPVFAFYGGTLFAFGGVLALVVGSAVAAQVIIYLLALAMAYGGWLWLGRMAGLRPWPAHLPAILYVTAPFVITNMYVRQDLTESVAAAAIPLLLASGLSVLRADRLRAGPAAALAISTVTLGGSHNLTLLWGTTIVGLTAVALAAAVPEARRMVTRRGALRVLAVVVPAMAVNAWYLVPDLAYHADTVISHRIGQWRSVLTSPASVVSTKHLFALGRPSAFAGSGLTCALPVLAIAWVLLAAVLGRAGWRGAWGRTLAVLTLATAAVLVVMAHPSLILWLPDPWLMLQFSYRLGIFALFGICGAVIAALALTGRHGHRWLSVLLLPIVALGIVGATKQIRDFRLYPIDFAVPIDTFAAFSIGDFADATSPPRPQPASIKLLVLKRADAHRDHLGVTIAAAPGDVLYTDLMVPPRMIDIQGARVIGRWEGAPLVAQARSPWYLVLRTDRSAGADGAHITIREARTLPIVGGRLLSLLGLLGLAANAIAIARARRRRAAT